MKTNKLKYLIVGLIILLSSCSKFLDKNPITEESQTTFYRSAGDFESALYGVYNIYQQNLYYRDLLMLTELTTDNVVDVWTNPTVSEMEINQSRITSNNGQVQSVWTNFYSIISKCNWILVSLDKTNIEENKSKQFRGETLFLRSLAYFHLVRLFGELPMVKMPFTSPEEINSFDNERHPVESIYSLIFDDLKTSANLLQGMNIADKSRISEGTALTVLGQAYLTIGDLDNARVTLKSVIDMNQYDLMPDYGVLFTNGNNNLKETIWQINYMSGQVGEGNSYATYFTPASFNMAILPNKLQGNGLMNPTKNMFEAYESGDLRRDISISDSLLLNDGTKSAEMYGRKFVDFTAGVAGDGGTNFTPYRYADVLLMYAEVLNLQDKTEDAYQYINLVRNRAGLGDLSGLTKSELDSAIIRERRSELFLEGDRWYTLIRKGSAISVMDNYYKEIGQDALKLESFRLLMPIPQRERDIRPDLGQNTGY